MALSRRKSKDLLLDGRMRPYQNSIAYQKEKGKDFFRKICTFSWFFRKEGVIGGLKYISNGTKLDSGDVLDAPLDLHQRFSGERHAAVSAGQVLFAPCLFPDGCGGYFPQRGWWEIVWSSVPYCLLVGFLFILGKSRRKNKKKPPKSKFPLRKHCFSGLWVS